MKSKLGYKLHILSALNSYIKEKPVRFHMPGHKADKNFSKLFPIAKTDVTELDFSDNLDEPTSVIEHAERDIAGICGAKKSFILTDGSSSGIYAMLKAVKPLGSKILICRNSHRSVYNACEILGIEPIILNHNFKHNIMLAPSYEEVESLIKKDSDIIGALITTPDYYGNIADLAKISAVLSSRSKLLLVDGAHGSHLLYTEGGLHYAGKYADIWVDGLHKTTPCLTQGALLHTSKEEFISPIKEALSYFRTSSPSYPIMASAEYAVKYCVKNSGEMLSNLFFAVSEFKKRLVSRNYRFYKADDFLKLAVDFKETGVSAEAALCFLQNHGIYAEFCDGRFIMFYLSVATTKSHLLKLEKILKKLLRVKAFKNTYQPVPALKTGKKSFSYLVACEMEKKLCPIELSEGRICAKNAGTFPPCVPLVVAGEAITAEIIEVLVKRQSTFGMQGKNIYVVK